MRSAAHLPWNPWDAAPVRKQDFLLIQWKSVVPDKHGLHFAVKAKRPFSIGIGKQAPFRISNLVVPNHHFRMETR